MAFEIVWTKKATSSFEKVVSYLEENWTEKEIRKFVGNTDRLLNVIQEFPLSFPESAHKHVRKIVIGRQNILFYRFKKNRIELLLFWDGRQDPKTLNKLLK